ncbi:MAG: helix-turn-helix domain-containing protein [Nitrospirota bacterium]
MRKTDDSVILQMHEEGKSLKEIAKEFECSKTAISKRLKRLKGKPEVNSEKKVQDNLTKPEAPILPSTIEPLDLPEIEAPAVPEKEYAQGIVATGNYLRKIGTREVFAYSDRLMQRGDMIPYVGPIPVPSNFEVPQFEFDFLRFITGKGMFSVEDFNRFAGSVSGNAD